MSNSVFILSRNILKYRSGGATGATIGRLIGRNARESSGDFKS